jgi:hypothetical protein
MKTCMLVFGCYFAGILAANAPAWVMAFFAGMLCFFAADLQDWIRMERKPQGPPPW